MSTAGRDTALTAYAAASRRVLEQFPGDEEGRMLQSPGLKTAGTFYGFASRDGLVVKLPAVRVRDIIAAGQGLPCSPRPGRPMNEWVRIPQPDEASCLSYLLEARAFGSTRAAEPTAQQAP